MKVEAPPLAKGETRSGVHTRRLSHLYRFGIDNRTTTKAVNGFALSGNEVILVAVNKGDRLGIGVSRFAATDQTLVEVLTVGNPSRTIDLDEGNGEKLALGGADFVFEFVLIHCIPWLIMYIQ